MGGSQGAPRDQYRHGGGRAGDCTVAAANTLTHQSGERDLELVRAGYRAAGLAARVAPFLDEMDREMAAAQLIVCRAGRLPWRSWQRSAGPRCSCRSPRAANDHQRRNAAAIEAAGAAEVVDERELSGVTLGARIVALASDDDRRAALAGASRRLARPGAAGAVVGPD